MWTKLFSLGPRFLASQASGWLAVGGLGLLAGAWVWYDTLSDKYERLKAKCLQVENPSVDDLGDELSEIYRERFDDLRKAVRNSDEPCFDVVYPADSESSPLGRVLPSREEG